MPEGDTIHRTADSLRRWLGGRTITAARARVTGFPAARLVGRRVEAVEARGKHLLVRLDGGSVLHTHMRMTGSWHVYTAGERWRRPERQARLVVEAGEHVAVCFNAPVVELLAARAELLHPSLGGLGPDVLGEPLDLEAIRTRARAAPSSTTLGELLLDQRVVSGIGNIWRSESLFVRGLHPAITVDGVDDDGLDALVVAAAELMKRPPPARYVYRRTNRPCRRCSTSIRSAPHGEPARTIYWCPTCQPRAGSASSG